MSAIVPPADLRSRFDEHGYVVLRGVIDPMSVAEVLENVARIIANADGAAPPDAFQFDDVARASTLKQVQQLWRHDAWFAALMERLRPIAEAALGERCVPQNMQYFNKPPTAAYAAGKSSQPTPPHQDGYYFMTEPMRALTMWLALDHADEANGCLRYVRGSASAGLRKHEYSGVVGFSQRIVDFDAGGADGAREVPVCAAPGDLIIHHAMQIHRAERNSTADRHRRAVGAIFCAQAADRTPAAPPAPTEEPAHPQTASRRRWTRRGSPRGRLRSGGASRCSLGRRRLAARSPRREDTRRVHRG
jgi:phytanoyl-CoA hydroxylase